VTIQTKATEQYFPVVLFIIMFKEVLAFDCVNEILSTNHLCETNEHYFPSHNALHCAVHVAYYNLCVTIQIKVIKLYCSVSLFAVLFLLAMLFHVST